MKNSFAFCRENGQCTNDSYSYVSTDNEQTLMSTVARQPMSTAIEADQYSFQLYPSDVFTTSRSTSLDHGVLPSVTEVRLAQTTGR